MPLYQHETSEFSNNQHFFECREGVVHDWPFWNFEIGDYLLVGDGDPEKAKKARNRAMTAASYYKRTRGFQFRSQRLTAPGNPGDIVYKVWREA